MMAFVMMIVGAILFYTERFSFGNIQTAGRHVKAAGVVLMLPSGGALVLSLLIGMFFGGNLELLSSLLLVISLAEFLAMYAAIAIAYILIVNPANAPRLPGILGEIQAGIDTQTGPTPTRQTAGAPSVPRSPAPPAQPTESKRILSVPEAALYLGMTEGQVLQLIDEGKLPAARANYRYQIARSQLDEILKLRQVELV
jgi:excisionase family DNA binding protein